MKQRLSRISSYFDRTLNLLSVFAIVLLFFIMLSVTLEVVMRVFLKHGLIWVLEFNRYALVYITFLTFAWLLKNDGHVKMDIVYQKLKPKAQAMLDIITSIIGAVSFFLITWYGTSITWKYFQLNATMDTMVAPPAWLFYGIVPLGTLLVSIQFARIASNSWRTLREIGRRTVDGSET